MAKKPKLGSSGKFPRGKLNRYDEGELTIAISGDPKTNTVIIDFGKRVKWIGFGPDQARELADLIRKNADKLSQ